ncbi:LysM domain-containing protein [Carnobacterium maltaromaticum]|uniref:LysM domain-containing protein n=1 Tax=Carnobacterium maltaromaticum TaxID=2751 RepID=A0AAW9JR52_CARML|nr:LysM domain-containing protein [Carnobacterium maltaromaticum]MDZ5758063.1 LysM domain-containing protein [Carnobacterium maltaromaticum]
MGKQKKDAVQEAESASTVEVKPVKAVKTPSTEFMETKPAIHIVDDGETLYSIATKHGITVGLLKELNFNDTNPNVYVGQQLKLKG